MTTITADTWKNLNDVTYNRSLQTVMSQPNTLYGNAINNTTSVAVSSPYNTYTVLRTITFTTKKANTSFLLMGTAQVWIPSDSSGFNIGFNYGGTMILGYDGSSGDSWMGFGHGAQSANTYSRTRTMIHSPNVAANTSISYSLMIAKWNTGTLYVGGNVGYQNGVLFSVTELEN